MSALKAKVVGTKRLKSRLRKLKGDKSFKLGRALYQEAEIIMTEAKKLTPVLTGALRSSGHVALPRTSVSGKITVEMGFGGPAGSGNMGGQTNKTDVGYAIKVHEDMTAHHRTGQAKYLEEPLKAAEVNLSRRIARRLK